MAIQLKYISTDNNLITKTNEALDKLGDRVIDVEVHKNDTISGGGYSIIKYHSDPKTLQDRRKVLNE